MPFLKGLEIYIEKAFDKLPALTTISIVFAICLLLILLIGVFYRIIIKGDSLNFWGIELKNDRCYRDLQEMYRQLKTEFDALNQDCKQKSNIMKILNQITIEVGKVMTYDDLGEFTKKRNMIYNLALTAIISNLTKDKDNNHRVAIFTPDGDTGKLKIFRGLGFSPDGIEYLRLDISDSMAGWVYQNNKPQWTGDVQKEKLFYQHPKSKNYFSLICVPISSGEKVWGVLSLDGSKPDSFTADDVDYLSYFATLFTALFAVEPFVEDRHARKLGRREDDEQKVRVS